MIGTRSVLARLALRLVLLTAVTVALILAVLTHRFQSSAYVLQDRGLYSLAKRIADGLTIDAAGALRLALPGDLAQRFDTEHGLVFSVSDASAWVVLGDAVEGRALHPFQPHSGSNVEYFQHVSPVDGETYYGITLQTALGDRRYWVQVSREVGHSEELIEAAAGLFFSSVLWVIVPFLAGFLFVTLLSIRRALDPLRVASARAAAVGPGATDVRLPEEGMPREILPLVQAVNSALDRLEKAFEAQRQFTAEAAHELLTPLAVMRAHIDMMPDKAVAGALAEDVASLTDTVHQLLELAELEAREVDHGRQADLRDICTGVAAMVAPLAYRDGKALAVTGAEGPVIVSGSAEAIGRAVRNLVDNALANTPKGTTVEINVAADGAVRVTDAGPGIPADQREVMFGRFWRGNRSGGAGLGLSIVARIVAAHHGSIEVGDAPGGGAMFTLRLPRPAGPPSQRPGAAAARAPVPPAEA